MSDLPPQPEGRGGNILTNKIGPLPGWAWLLAVALLAYLYISNKNKQASAANTAAQSQAQNAGGSVLTNSSGQPIDYLQQETVATPVQNGDQQGQGYTPQTSHHHYSNQGTITPVTGAQPASDSLSNGSVPATDPTTQVTTPQTGS